jgi:two-component system sensor histidine kinase UhpB
MKLSLRLKINLVVTTLTTLFAAALMWQQFESMRQSVLEETVAANRVASQLLNRTVWGYAAQGKEVLLAFLQGVGRVRSNDIALYDNQGRLLYTSPPSPYKAGRFAPAWFDRLIAPEGSVQSIAFPDGKLVVQSNASRSVLDAWDTFSVLAGASLGLLLVLNGLLFWVVGRTARPFGQIVAALNRLEAGDFNASLPKLNGAEAAAIGGAFNRMVGVLQDNLATERRAARAERELLESRELARWIDHHIERERRMIARELHDELGQSVTAIRSMALSIAQRMAARDATSEQAARLIAQESSRLYDAMHGMIPRLTPLVLDSFGLSEAVEDLVERTHRSQPGLQIDWRVALGDVPLSPDAALALFRAAQEGITNAVRHGQAQSLRLQVLLHGPASTGSARAARAEMDVDEVGLDLVDDGIGLQAAAAAVASVPASAPASVSAPGASDRASHFGLRWLSERVEALGGHVVIEPADPARTDRPGTVLRVRLPLAQARARPAVDAAGAPATSTTPTAPADTAQA